MPLAVDLADYVLGTLAPHELPDACCRALEEGYESPSLAALAGTTTATYERWEVEDLWQSALRELHLVLPTKEVAAEIIVSDATKQALDGTVTPAVAVARIVNGAYYASGACDRDANVAGDSMDLNELVGIFWMYDEIDQPWAPTRVELDRDALEALRRLRERRPTQACD